MDTPSRMPRPSDRRVINRSGTTSSWQPAEEPQPVKAAPAASASRATSSHHSSSKEKKSSRKPILPFLIILTVVLLGIIGWLAFSGLRNAGTGIDSGRYQAVFFTNGQVYFGKLAAFNDDYMKLTEIYYLQAQAGESGSENPQATNTDQNSNVQLIKLGEEIHGPEDEMIISKDQVLFYENLKTDSKVVQSIGQFKRSN